ncbi:MAG TPA: MraY family glycosyltransferase [Terriglobales bacterium]|nr:MraY family glycosyltransferase [Terriglobales bacterium]
MTGLFLGAFATSLGLSFVSTKFVRDFAIKKNWVAAPAHERHLHSNALPRLGGIAIAFSFLLTTALALLYESLFAHHDAGFSPSPLLTILPPALLIFLLGVYDDLRTAGQYLKFLVQAVAGAMLFAGGLRVSDLPLLFGHHQFPWFVGLPLTIFWVMAITNAFNLIDGLDGLAAGSALFSTLVVFVIALLGNAPLISLVTLALAGSVLGFLRYNFNPATIFLGDCGSLFIGFMLSALALQGAQKAPTIVAVAIPVVSFGLPILETLLSIVRRFISGRPVFTADREHIHHKLLQLGWSHRQAVIILYAVSGVFALLSLFLLWPTGSTLGLVLAVLGTGVWIGVQHLGYLEFGEIRRVAQRTIDQRRIFVNNLAIRRATEELKVAEDFQQVARILTAAFTGNDFDAFELSVRVPARALQIVESTELPHLRWTRPGAQTSPAFGNAWRINLDLVTASNQYCGNLSLFRGYVKRDLQLDINLLTSVFPTSLAEALHRTAAQNIEFISASQNAVLAPAQAG